MAEAENERRRGEASGFSVGAVIAVALIAGFLVWLLLIRDGDDDAATTTTGDPVEASQADLRALSEEIGQPIYWLGEQEGTKLELTRLANGQVYLRYLPDDVEIGAQEPDFLSIGTYPVQDAFDVLETQAEGPDAVSSSTDDGDTVIVTSEATPESVYFASQRRNRGFQVEVYDPDPERALQLAESGRVRPIR